MSWFVLTELPYEGTMVVRYEDKAKARVRYEEDKAQVGGYYKGVALIKGEVVESKDYNLEVWD